MNGNFMKQLKIIVLVLSGILISSTNCKAHILEVFAAGQQMLGDKTTFNEQKLNVKDNILGGFGAGFNLDNYNLNILLLFGETKINMEDKVLKSSLFAFEANFEYAFLNRSFSPVLGAGIGSINYTDSFTASENLNEVDVSYNISGGIKWVLNEDYFVKALYKSTWTKIKHTDSSLNYRGISLSVGLVF